MEIEGSVFLVERWTTEVMFRILSEPNLVLLYQSVPVDRVDPYSLPVRGSL